MKQTDKENRVKSFFFPLIYHSVQHSNTGAEVPKMHRFSTMLGSSMSQLKAVISDASALPNNTFQGKEKYKPK